MADSKLRELSTDFSVKVIKTCDGMKGHYSLVNQLKRSSTRRRRTNKRLLRFFYLIFRISIDPVSIFFRVEGLKPANFKNLPAENKEKDTAVKPCQILFEFISPINKNF